MATTREIVSEPGGSPDDPRFACDRCGYDRTGLGADAACPECGEIHFEPEGLVANFRHAWRTSARGTLRYTWIFACIAAFAAALVILGLFLVFGLVMLDKTDGWSFFAPVFGWLFIVMPAAGLALLNALASLGAGDRRLPRYGAALACGAICTPVVVLFLISIVGRAFDW